MPIKTYKLRYIAVKVEENVKKCIFRVFLQFTFKFGLLEGPIETSYDISEKRRRRALK